MSRLIEVDGQLELRPAAGSPESAVEAAAPESIESIIARYFGPYAAQASDIAWCESTHTPDVISRTNDYGLFQINRPSHEGGLVRQLGYSMDDMLTTEANVHVAWELFDQSGQSWGPWSCARKLGLS